MDRKTAVGQGSNPSPVFSSFFAPMGGGASTGKTPTNIPETVQPVFQNDQKFLVSLFPHLRGASPAVMEETLQRLDTYIYERQAAIKQKQLIARMPKRLILIKHGQSIVSHSPEVCSTVPDNQIPLDESGVAQAREAGRKLRELCGNEKTLFLVSPFLRTQQTYRALAESFDPAMVHMQEEPRIREQECGNLQNTDPTAVGTTEHLRTYCGPFYFRFSSGESGGDAFDRTAAFLESLGRQCRKNPAADRNIVLVTHGLICRLFLAGYFHWPVGFFHRMRDFDPCQPVVLELAPDGRYQLQTPLRVDRAPHGGGTESPAGVLLEMVDPEPPRPGRSPLRLRAPPPS
ncbi:putative phosphoglycerate-bisphosphoglycerate mutase [Paratrimastix pyriformis]|uniref:Phosphoglycerate-bisphosphoglycerate mutase n=1 Tax=Paratrimastix pyriformis TaxID=342808 RepID=A0ABQ8UUZ8_9EUKA|nr:putative phosphoglycerate-bisphosphoglycerate mutase [Paratrimastix pyriformis]